MSWKSNLGYILGVTLLGSSISITAWDGFNKTPPPPITSEEYSNAVSSCSFSEGVESYNVTETKVQVYCYDGGVKWVSREH